MEISSGNWKDGTESKKGAIKPYCSLVTKELEIDGIRMGRLPVGAPMTIIQGSMVKTKMAMMKIIMAIIMMMMIVRDNFLFLSFIFDSIKEGSLIAP